MAVTKTDEFFMQGLHGWIVQCAIALFISVITVFTITIIITVIIIIIITKAEIRVALSRCKRYRDDVQLKTNNRAMGQICGTSYH